MTEWQGADWPSSSRLRGLCQSECTFDSAVFHELGPCRGVLEGDAHRPWFREDDRVVDRAAVAVSTTSAITSMKSGSELPLPARTISTPTLLHTRDGVLCIYFFTNFRIILAVKNPVHTLPFRSATASS